MKDMRWIDRVDYRADELRRERLCEPHAIEQVRKEVENGEIEV